MKKIQILSIKLFVLLVSMTSFLYSQAQQGIHNYNLVQLLQQNQLITAPQYQTRVLDDPQKQAITTSGVVWLKDTDFKEGSIEIDLRGKDVFLQSFLGIAFHGVDTATYDVVYFRPFNFRHTDTFRRKWSVQYMSLPEYDYDKLRKEHPLVYENSVDPVPQAADWFHATIAVKDGWVTVYVNHSAKASLKVKLLNSRSGGSIGLWTSALNGDFANLSLTK